MCQQLRSFADDFWVSSDLVLLMILCQQWLSFADDFWISSDLIFIDETSCQNDLVLIDDFIINLA